MKIFKNRSEFKMPRNIKLRLDKEIDIYSSLNNDVFFKVKEYELGYYINFIIDKKLFTKHPDVVNPSSIPDFITFLSIFDYAYPTHPPKILAKTNFHSPNLMDGKDLSEDVLPNWTPSMSLEDIAKSFPLFLQKVFTAKGYHRYGKYHIGAIYDLRNFHNMLVNTFNCKFDLSVFDDEQLHGVNMEDSDYTLILSDDSFVLFQNFENDLSIGKVIFWATLHSIIDIKVYKKTKVVKIRMFADNDSHEKQLRLRLKNAVFFREALVKNMLNLKVQVVKGQPKELRLTLPEMNAMSINEIVEQIDAIEKKIVKGEASFYYVNTFSVLCGKAIEYYSSIESEKHLDVLLKMKAIFSREDVKQISSENE